MIKSVLLDLDNTLLHNPDRAFAIEYLRLADIYFQEHWGYSQFSKLLRHNIPIIQASLHYHQTNHSVLLAHYADHLNTTQEEVQKALNDFYLSVYTQLQPCTRPMAGVRELITQLRANDYSVVIATNPIYPAIAVQQRLGWAGIPDDFKDFAFVTHSENMHFAKPTTEYYAEILARVGVEPDEAIMVGDSIKNDIIPAQTLGIHTYWITETETTENSGSLQSLCEKLENGWLETLIHMLLKPASIKPQLRGNLGALFGLLDLVQDHFWYQHPDPNEWSILQILCHLLASESQVQRPRLQRILEVDNPFLASPPPPVGASAELCADNGFNVAHQFIDERNKTIEFIDKLHEDDWLRPARHSIFGMTNLLEMAHFTAQHDRLHLTQLCQTIGNCH